jgi:hypothetical protein
MRIFINSIENGTGSVRNIDISTSTSAPIRIGNRFSDARAIFQGNISNVQIYNRALTAEEIGQNFEATRGRYGI